LNKLKLLEEGNIPEHSEASIGYAKSSGTQLEWFFDGRWRVAFAFHSLLEGNSEAFYACCATKSDRKHCYTEKNKT
jgi:hypothetical protein